MTPPGGYETERFENMTQTTAQYLRFTIEQQIKAIMRDKVALLYLGYRKDDPDVQMLDEAIKYFNNDVALLAVRS